MKQIATILSLLLSLGQLNGQGIMDFSGKKISAFIINGITEKFAEIKLNESVKVKTDNYTAIQSDLFAWSRITGNKVIQKENTSDCLTFEIIKSTEGIGHGKSFSIIISDKGLEELLSPLGFSLSAALSGYNVNIYFQGPAVKVLENGFKEKLKGLSSPFSGFARNGLNKIGHSPAQEKLWILEKHGAKFFVCQPSMDHFKVKEENIIFPNHIICEYFTFLEVMEKSDIKFFIQ
jgi:predicted peroxiredoxin